MKILPFLKTFSTLSRAGQQVFLFCLEKKPFPRRFTGDIDYIAAGTGYHRKTVEQMLKKISTMPELYHMVCYIHLNVKDEYKRKIGERLNRELDKYW